MFIHLGRPILIDSIKFEYINIQDLRDKAKILVIDDLGFPMQEVLQNHGFNIKKVRDIESLDFVEKYQIIICDIRGVGKSFGSEYEGAHLFSQIRKAYPDKYIIASSAFTFDPGYNKYFADADISIKKDVDSATWVECLDDAIKIIIDPINRWKRVRKHLLNNHSMDLWDLTLLELATTKAIINNSATTIESFKMQKTNTAATSLIKSFAKTILVDSLLSIGSKVIIGD